MGKLVVLEWWKLEREVRAEHERVELWGDRYSGRVPRAPSLEELEGDTDWIQDPYSLDTDRCAVGPLEGPRLEGGFPGWGWRWL